jgi:murein L,D-transpeptidase YafK
MRPRPLSLLALVSLLGCLAEAQAMAFLPDFIASGAAPDFTERERRGYEGLLADKVVVKKSERRLYLVKDGEPIASYHASLGFAPEGHKERQGDGRTPEGRYHLDWRNPQSRFHKSLHVSYPDVADRARARRKGLDPGGMIMIHGQPRSGRYPELQRLIAEEDWTQGCIAVSNDAIDAIWEKTVDGIPIEILP